jgi:hypothetical protein
MSYHRSRVFGPSEVTSAINAGSRGVSYENVSNCPFLYKVQCPMMGDERIDCGKCNYAIADHDFLTSICRPDTSNISSERVRNGYKSVFTIRSSGGYVSKLSVLNREGRVYIYPFN